MEKVNQHVSLEVPVCLCRSGDNNCSRKLWLFSQNRIFSLSQVVEKIIEIYVFFTSAVHIIQYTDFALSPAWCEKNFRGETAWKSRALQKLSTLPLKNATCQIV